METLTKNLCDVPGCTHDSEFHIGYLDGDSGGYILLCKKHADRPTCPAEFIDRLVHTKSARARLGEGPPFHTRSGALNKIAEYKQNGTF